jgi:hypothetical protein
MTDEAYNQNKTATEAAHEPGRFVTIHFVTIHAYEWSGMTEVGGDHNIYFRGTDTLLM